MAIDMKHTQQIWLILSNVAMCMGWARVLYAIVVQTLSSPTFPNNDTWCRTHLSQTILLALGISFLELCNATLGLTRSKSHQVLLFAVVRFGVERIVAPRLPCLSWQHGMTVVSWSVGDTLRFACFAIDTMCTMLDTPNVAGDASTTNTTHNRKIANATRTTLWQMISYNARFIRYTVGPLLFPIGAMGEMLMVLSVGMEHRSIIIIGASLLWPLGFYPLYRQLLFQRRKFLQQQQQQWHDKPHIKQV